MNAEELSRTRLFRGIAPDDIPGLLKCLNASRRSYKKGEQILRAGDCVKALGLVLSGGARIEHDDFWGNRSVLDNVGAGGIFAEAYACAPGEPLMVSVVAAEPSEVLFLDAERITGACEKACHFHGRLIRNLLEIASRKNLTLSRRIFHTSSKTIRGRLLSYLSYQAAAAGGGEFSIPFDRQQLANYLSVDRSAMSSELGKLKREGLLEVNRNKFRLLKED